MMEKYMVHSLSNAEYAELITILDYEISLSFYLSELVFPDLAKGKKAIVDLALKAGLDSYRFVSFDIDESGKIINDSHRYVDVSRDLEVCANGFLKEQREIVKNSILTLEQKSYLLN